MYHNRGSQISHYVKSCLQLIYFYVFFVFVDKHAANHIHHARNIIRSLPSTEIIMKMKFRFVITKILSRGKQI